jgi:hypothetical protein
MSVKIRHLVWRDGRPRFSPGPVARWLGFDGKDLRHPDGAWFTLAECRNFSVEITGQIAARKIEAQRAGRTRPAAEPSPKRLTNEDGFVYFLRSGARVKIGFSKNPWMRAATPLTGLPHGVDAMVMVPGSERDERRLHRELEAFRQRGEWFDVHPKVLEVMHRAVTFCRTAGERKDAA